MHISRVASRDNVAPILIKCVADDLLAKSLQLVYWLHNVLGKYE
jgi:hypothetical protein